MLPPALDSIENSIVELCKKTLKLILNLVKLTQMFSHFQQLNRIEALTSNWEYKNPLNAALGSL